MGIWQRLFGREAAAAIPTFGQPAASAAPTPDDSARLRAFLAAAPLDESQRDALVALVGVSPGGLESHNIQPDDWTGVISRIRNHIDGPYPVKLYEHLPNRPFPDYRMIDGKVARASNLAYDTLLCTGFPRTRGSLAAGSPHVLVGTFIQVLSDWPLSKLIFYLPRFVEATAAAATGKSVVLIIEDLFIQANKGVENALFGLYDDLPEGGMFSDEALEHKLWSFLDAPARRVGTVPLKVQPLANPSRVHLYPTASVPKAGASTSSDDGWFIVIRGEQYGPFALDELKRLTTSSAALWPAQTPMVRRFMAEWQHQPKASIKRSVRGRLCNVRNLEALRQMYPEVVDCFRNDAGH
jgi:hypothetical protein